MTLTHVTSSTKLLKWLLLTSRIILASVVSYGVATLSALACLALPIDRISAIYWGYIVSAVVCTLMIMLAFLVRNLWRAWALQLVLAAVFGSIWYFGTSS